MNPHRRGRRLLAASSLGLVAFAGGAVVHAQGGGRPPVVHVSVDKGKAPVFSGPTALSAGPTTFHLTSASKPDTSEGTIVALGAGVDPAKFAKSVETTGGDPDKIEALLGAKNRVVGDAFVSKGHPRAITVTLAAGSYVLISTGGEKKQPATPFTVGAPANGASTPAATTTVGMYDYGYRISGALKRGTTVRFANKGKRIHMAIPFKVANKAAALAADRALRTAKNPEAVLKKYVRGQGTSGVGALSPGGAQSFRVADSPGTYIFVCFWGSKQSKGVPHFALGMEKAYTVR